MASLGYGANVHYGTGTPPTITTPTVLAAAIISITPPNIEADDVPVYHFNTTNQVKETIAGWTEPGELSITAHYDKTEFATLLSTLFKTSKTWRISFNDSTTTADSGLLFVGYVKSISPAIDLEGLIECTIVVKVTSLPVLDSDISA
jgi:hypothetical protein